MEDWYRDLLSQGQAHAERSFLQEYASHAGYLAGLRGKVLDLGGGAGLAARFLDPGCDYTVADPAAVWDEPEWRAFSQRFCGERHVQFVRAHGEDLPFGDAVFDAGLAFWSLNHAQDPRACIGELSRVVRPGGRILLVLEDMEPGWGDLLRAAYERFGTISRLLRREPVRFHQARRRGPARVLWDKLMSKDWPLADDHTRIVEADLRSWLGCGLKVDKRGWRDGCLTLELVKTV